MDNNILNSLVVYKGKYFSDLVDEDRLSEAFMTHPTEIGQVVSYAFGTKNLGYGTSIDMITGGVGRTETIETRMWTWKIGLDSDRAINIHRASVGGTEITSSNYSTLTPGLNMATITLWLEDKWFGPGAILRLDDPEYQLRVQSAPTQDGSYWVYNCVIADGQTGSYVPGEYLLPNCQVSRLASAYEENSDESDIINYGTNIELRNCLTTLRLSYDITGTAHSTVMAIQLTDPVTGKKSFLWEDVQLWTAMNEWYKRLESSLVYSKTSLSPDGTTNLVGSNGRPIYIGAGLLQQISPANKINYTKLTAEIFEEFLSDLSYNILGSNERNFIALTGEMGMAEFDRAMKDKYKTLGLTTVDSKFISGNGQELALGASFKTYNIVNDITVTVKHLPLLDSRENNRKLHPITKKPAESYKFIILDNSMKNGSANVTQVVRKDRELVIWNNSGSVAPGEGYGKERTTSRANAKDGYSVLFLGDRGIYIKDPRACGIIELDVE